MKYLYIIMLTLLSVGANASQCYDLNDSQKEVLAKAYDVGLADNLGYTMMAIAFEESTAGKYRMSFETHDYGVMQNNIKTASSRMGVKGYYNKLALAERLIKDDELSMNLALEELLYWKKHTPNWRGMVSAYNNGWAWSKGDAYLDKIIKHTNTFIKCWEKPMPVMKLASEPSKTMQYFGADIPVPDDYKYVAMDLDGSIYAFLHTPMLDRGEWGPNLFEEDVPVYLNTVVNSEEFDWTSTLMEVDKGYD